MNQENEKKFDKVCNYLIVIATSYFVVRVLLSMVFGI